MARPWNDQSRLQRKIRFYRITPVGDSDTDAPFEIVSVLDELEALLGTDDRYLEQGERVTFCVPESRRPLPHVRLLNVRRRDLPQIERAGLLSPLPLDPDAGLAEQVHLVFFRHNVIGSEFNFYGARPGRFAEFLRAKRIGPRIEVKPLLRDDVIRQLDEMEEIRMARIKVKRGSTGLIRRADRTLADALDQTAEFSSGADIDMILRRPPRTHDGLPDRVKRAFRALAGNEELRSEVSAIQLEGRNPHTDEFELVDLLDQELVAVRRILRADERSRVLDSADAYAAIESAHAELANEIGRAATILPSE